MPLQSQRASSRPLLLWAALVAVSTGALTAFSLQSLDFVTCLFWAHPELIFGLPAAGVLVAWIYRRWGGNADKGTDLLLNEIRSPSHQVSSRMAPLVLLGTLVTHAFGGSAGREGTAVQMGGGVAGGLAAWIKLGTEETRILLMCGMAAGFGAVFGTPFSGAVFAAEVLRTGLPVLRSVLPVLLSAWLAHWTCMLLGATHTHYHVDTATMGFSLFGKVLLAATAFGLAARLFVTLHHASKRCFSTLIAHPLLRPAVGALLVILFAWALDAQDGLGLGVEPGPAEGASITGAFLSAESDPFVWLKKSVLTVLTVGSGFKGGEVTPLFFVGSTLGSFLSSPLSAPVDLLAALGFVSVFGAASKTPLACTLMGVELFGTGNAVALTLACIIARIVSGRAAIYAAPPSSMQN